MGFLTRHQTLARLISCWTLIGFSLLCLTAPAARTAEPTSEDAVQSSSKQTQRQHDRAIVNSVLERQTIRDRLNNLGFTVAEIEERLDRLSDEKIHHMAQRLESVKTGGHLRFPSAKHHRMPFVIYVILLPILAFFWLLSFPFHRHGPPNKVPPGQTGHPQGGPPGQS